MLHSASFAFLTIFPILPPSPPFRHAAHPRCRCPCRCRFHSIGFGFCPGIYPTNHPRIACRPIPSHPTLLLFHSPCPSFCLSICLSCFTPSSATPARWASPGRSIASCLPRKRPPLPLPSMPISSHPNALHPTRAIESPALFSPFTDTNMASFPPIIPHGNLLSMGLESSSPPDLAWTLSSLCLACRSCAIPATRHDHGEKTWKRTHSWLLRRTC